MLIGACMWSGTVTLTESILSPSFVQKLTPVLVAAGIGECGGGFLHPGGIDIADGGDVDLGVGREVHEIAPALAIDADGGVAELLVRGIGSLGAPDLWEEEWGCCGEGGVFEKAAAGMHGILDGKCGGVWAR